MEFSKGDGYAEDTQQKEGGVNDRDKGDLLRCSKRVEEQEDGQGLEELVRLLRNPDQRRVKPEGGQSRRNHRKAIEYKPEMATASETGGFTSEKDRPRHDVCTSGERKE